MIECHDNPYLLDTKGKALWANKHVPRDSLWRVGDHCPFRPEGLTKAQYNRRYYMQNRERLLRAQKQRDRRTGVDKKVRQEIKKLRIEEALNELERAVSRHDSAEVFHAATTVVRLRKTPPRMIT